MREKFLSLFFAFAFILFGGVIVNNYNKIENVFAETTSELNTVANSNKIIEISKTDDNQYITIDGHYLEKNYCTRITYVLSKLYVQSEIELENGYGKYTYSDELWNILNEIENDSYSVWQTEEYKTFVSNLSEENYLFWFTDTATFQDKYGDTYTFVATQATSEEDEDESNKITDKYGNYSYDNGATWIMPVATTTQSSTRKISSGNLDIDVEVSSTGWRVVNKGTLVCKCKSQEGLNYLYYDYPQEKQYVLSSVLDLTLAESTTLKEEFTITIQNNTIKGTEFVKQDDMIGFKQSDGSKILAYFNENSNKEVGWYLGVKNTSLQQSNPSIKLENGLVKNEELSLQAGLDDYTFTKVDGTPVVKAAAESSSNFTKFLSSNSSNTPSTGILMDNKNYVIPLSVITITLILTFGVLTFTIKLKSKKD